MSASSASTLHPAHADSAHSKPMPSPTPSPVESASDAPAAASAASLPSSAAAGRANHAVRTPLKRFSHGQIAEKVAERAGSIGDYYALLMSAAVKSDDSGVVFDSSSAGWKELVRRCEEADQRERDSRRSTQTQHRPAAAGGGAAASQHSSETTERRGREEERSRGRSISPLPSGSPSSTASPSPAQPSSSAAPLLLPASASSTTLAFFSKVSSIISSRPATAADAQQHSAEPAAEDSAAANGGRQQTRRPASSRSAAGHARHSSDVAASSPPVASPALSRPTSAHTLRPDRQTQEKKARRGTAHPSAPAVQQPGTQLALSPAAAAAAADTEPESSAAAATPAAAAAAAGASVRQVRLVRSAAHRTSGDRIRRSAGRELKDGSYVAADLQYEQRLLAELSGTVSDAAVIADWRERRQREMERETERKRREEAEERQRVAAGGRRRRKLVIPPTAVIQHAGAAVPELEYMQLLMAQLQHSADDDVDWTLVSRLAAVTGIPARHRKRLWTRLLRLRQTQEGEDEQEDDDRQDDQSSVSSNNSSEQKAEEDAVPSAASPDAASPASSVSAVEAASEPQRVSPSTFFSPLAVEAALPGSGSPASSAPPNSGSSSSLSSPKLDLINQRVIRVDIERTLPHLQSMRRADVRHDMEVLLTRYCKQQRISYKQGMNYLLAPFFFLQPPPLTRSGRLGLSSLYSAFISALLPNTFSDEEFGSLQCLFLLFRHLLLYHDPQLCLHLDQAEMGPELYASSWFITLYANRCRLEVALYLWDLLLLEADAGDPLLHYFVSLALLIANRAAILREAEVSLPELLSKLSINSRKDALTLLQRAKRLYRHNTSRGCMQRLHDITAAKVSIDSPAYSELAGWSCLQLSAEELIANLLPPAAPQPHSAASLKFFVLDCRPAERYESGHLPQSLHLDPSLLEERRADELERRMEGVMAMRGCHFALLADSSSSELEADGGGSPLPSAALSFLSLLLRRGIKYLSLISGGYSACHACILRLERSSELIDHRPDDCLDCNGKTAVRREKRTLLSSMRKIGSAMIARLDSSQQTAEQTQQAYYQFSPQHKAEHLPDAVALLPTTAQLRLLMTALRDRQCDDGVFADVVERLTAILVGSTMDRLELRERHVGTAAGGLYSGVESAYPVCSLSLDSAAERLVDAALRPYGSLIRVYRGRAAFQHYAQQTQQTQQQPPPATASSPRVLVAVDVPEPLSEYQILLLVPVLNNHNYPELLSLVTHLLACGSDLPYIAVLSLSAARSALWSVSSVYPSLLLLTAAVDEVRNGQLVPGILNLEQRWSRHRHSAAADSAHTAAAEPGQDEDADEAEAGAS